MLSVRNIVVHYGGIKALKGVSLEAAEGTITTLIGANGAGKSTTLRAISGMVPVTSGEIWFREHRIDGFDPEEIVEMGIGHVPEGKKLFLEMSIRDNLLTGAYLRRDKKAIDADLERVCRYFPVLVRAYNRPAAQMSGGEQQMLAIARGLMSAPKILLLDEPSLGLSPLLTREVGAIIRQIAIEGVTILLIEQNASLALNLAKQCYVLETGKVVLEGESCELQSNRHVKAAYLGVDPDIEGSAPGSEESAAQAEALAAEKPNQGFTGYEQESTLPARPRKNRIPPEAPPRLIDTWESPGAAHQPRDRWTLGDWEPTHLRPKDWNSRSWDTEQKAPDSRARDTGKPARDSASPVIKKVFKPKG